MKHYIGVDIGGMSIKYSIVSEKGEMVHKFGFPVKKGQTQEEIMGELAHEILQAIEDAKFSKEQIEGIGIGCPGSIDSEAGVCRYSNNLDWHDLPVVELLEKATGLKTKVSNDANVAMLGEAKFGAAKNYHNAILVTLGTGVGGGIYLNDRLYEGNKGMGAEIGHTIIVEKGEQCTCGLRGCLEAYASVSALIKQTKAAMKAHPESKMWDYVKGDIEAVNGKTSFETSKLGDETAIKVVDEYENHLVTGLTNLCNIFRPEAILIGGGLSYQKEYLTDALKRKLKEVHYGFLRTPEVEITVTNLGNDAGILGAAALWMD